MISLLRLNALFREPSEGLYYICQTNFHYS